MHDTPPFEPEAPVPAEEPRAFEPPKGFETRFKDLPLHLATFDGPLDLLLYLIREQKLDITNLPMADVTRQYMDSLLLMEELNLEIAAEFVAMAAQLLQIKSRLMLPRPPAEDLRGGSRGRTWSSGSWTTRQVKLAAQGAGGPGSSHWQNVVFAPGPGHPGTREGSRTNRSRPPCSTCWAPTGRPSSGCCRRLRSQVRTAPKTLDQRIARTAGRALTGGPLARRSTASLGRARSREELVLTFLALLEMVRTRPGAPGAAGDRSGKSVIQAA